MIEKLSLLIILLVWGMRDLTSACAAALCIALVLMCRGPRDYWNVRRSVQLNRHGSCLGSAARGGVFTPMYDCSPRPKKKITYFWNMGGGLCHDSDPDNFEVGQAKGSSKAKKSGSRKNSNKNNTSPTQSSGMNLAKMLNKAVSLAMKGGGTLLGGLVGQPSMGGQAGSWLSNVTGFGDYQVTSNSLITAPVSMGTGVPNFAGNSRSIRIKHREFIGDITSSVAFALTSFAINPGNPLLFPLLSTMATCTQQYRFHGLLFEFCSSSADALNSTNTALGTVIMATNYNVARPNFASKIEMEQSEFSCRTKPSESLLHPIECDPSEAVLSELYIRTGQLPSGQDQRFYDLGNFQIATVGMQAAATIGELWVTYDVELLKFRMPSQIAGGGNLEWAWKQGTTYSNTDPFNSGGLTVSLVGNIPVTVNNLVITFASSISAGTYLISAQWRGSSTACSISASTFSNCTAATGWYLTGDSNHSATSSQFNESVAVTITGYSNAGSTVTLVSPVLPTSGTYYQIFVTPVSSVPNSSPY